MAHQAFAIATPTKREMEILNIISYGYTIEEIASQLFISCETVKTHRKHLLQKFRARNKAQMIRMGFEYQLLLA